MIAIALACDPALLIADEPTTALDVTTQAQIIELVRTLQHDFGTAVVWISHDLGVIGQVADQVTVLRDGEAVEQAPVLDVFDRPHHDYTRELLAARPMIGDRGPAAADPGAPVLLDVRDLDVRFPVRGPTGTSEVHAVKRVSFEIPRGSTLGLVGESGSGSRRSLPRSPASSPRTAAAPRWATPMYSPRPAVPRRVCVAGSVWCSRTRSPR